MLMKVSRTLPILCFCPHNRMLYLPNYHLDFLILIRYLNICLNYRKTFLPSELHVLYHQISECLEQRPAKKTQIYFELKHHFESLHILRNENYTGEAFTLTSKRAMDVFTTSKMSWSFVKKSTVSGDLRDLGYCVDPPKVSFCQSRPFFCPSQSFFLSVTPFLTWFKTGNAWSNYQMKITTA